MGLLGRLSRWKKTEDPFFAQLAQVLKKAEIDVVFDVGANVGQYALKLLEAGFAGRIVSFEPVASAHAELTRVAAGNGHWQVASRMALGRVDGVGQLQVFNRTDMSSLLALRDEGLTAFPRLEAEGRQEVSIRRFDAIYGTYADETERAFLKIDTQGFEREILAGAEEMLPKLVGVQLEVALTPLYQNQPDYRELFERMRAIGYEPVLFSRGHFNKRLSRQIDFDAVFLRS